MVIGADEAGRGAWAGPLVIAAAKAKVTSPFSAQLLRDSKALTNKQRQTAYQELLKEFEVASAWISPEQISRYGLTHCSRKAFYKAAAKLYCRGDEVIVDGHINYLAGTELETCTSTLIKGDTLITEIMAASIAAKVLRDEYMCKIATQYQGYGFDKHVGYGTAVHRQALNELGVCALHRRNYRPVMEFL